MRLLFVYRGRSTPSGGHKQIRFMVSLLNELGVESFLLLDGSTEDDHLYECSVPRAPFLLSDARHSLRSSDVIVFPEIRLEYYLGLTRAWACRKAVNNQNGFYALEQRPPGGYRQNGVEFALANTPFVGSLTNEVLGIGSEQIFVVPHWVVRGPFVGDDATRLPRRLGICFMPRKLPDLVQSVRTVVSRVEPDVPWEGIHGVPEHVVAQRLRSHSILFSTQDREGCPLPALEAMCCGCLVAGYGGLGPFPHPYANEENGLWAADRSVDQATSQVLRAIRLVRENGPQLLRYLNAGRNTVEAYTKDAVKRALADMVSVVAERAYDQRPVVPRRLDLRSRLHARRILLEHRRHALLTSAKDWLMHMIPQKVHVGD